MTHILEIILLAVGVVGCIVVGLTVVLIFNINLKTFGKTKDNKIPQTDYGLKETAATILRYVARDVNRFSAQHKIENILDAGVDPLIEDILRQ